MEMKDVPIPVKENKKARPVIYLHPENAYMLQVNAISDAKCARLEKISMVEGSARLYELSTERERERKEEGRKRESGEGGNIEDIENKNVNSRKAPLSS